MDDGPTAAKSLIERRRSAMGSSYGLFYDPPFHPVRGDGAWLYDANGHAFLDAYNNVPAVGHGHPHVVAAVARQLATLNTHTRYLNEGVVACAERLLGLFPDPLDRIMFTCSGTEAVELALRLARYHTGGEGLIVTEHAYHGNSRAVAEISPGERAPEPRAAHVRLIPAPDCYRTPPNRDTGLCEYHLEHLDRAIGGLVERGVRPAALIVDTVLASAGILRAPEGYLRAAAERIRAAGGLLIADEIQAGHGRLGTHFWGFARHGAEPDIVTLGKPMGNGYPVAAAICRSAVNDSFARHASYFNTFGGTPAACAAATAVLEVIEKEGLQRRALDTGRLLREGLTDLARRFEGIGEVRGSGLFIGVDMVSDRRSRSPDTHTARAIVNGMRERGVLIGVAGPHANVLKIRPPLVFSTEHADLLLERLRSTLAALSGRRGDRRPGPVAGP